MRIVRKSFEPNVRQIQNMAENLGNKLNRTCKIEVSFWDREYHNEPYTLYIADNIPSHLRFYTWPELQFKYFELMKS